LSRDYCYCVDQPFENNTLVEEVNCEYEGDDEEEEAYWKGSERKEIISSNVLCSFDPRYRTENTWSSIWTNCGPC